MEKKKKNKRRRRRCSVLLDELKAMCAVDKVVCSGKCLKAAREKMSQVERQGDREK